MLGIAEITKNFRNGHGNDLQSVKYASVRDNETVMSRVLELAADRRISRRHNVSSKFTRHGIAWQGLFFASTQCAMIAFNP